MDSSNSQLSTQDSQLVGQTPTLPGLADLVKPFRFQAQPYEYKVVTLRECPTPDAMHLCDTADRAADYWRLHLPANPYFSPDNECPLSCCSTRVER
jgi:hypothetical protein